MIKLRVAALGALAAVTLGLSLISLLALNFGGGGGLGPWSWEISAGYAKHAQDLASAFGRDHQALEAAAAANRRAIALYPYDVGAWLRLADLDVKQHGALTSNGRSAVDSSYQAISIDPALALWRLKFCLNHWDAVTPHTRRAARNEFLALASSGRHRAGLRQLLESVSNPAGRLTAALWEQTMVSSWRHDET
jgi:hypothetical protein